jgi:uncharacterized membrane protein
LPDWQKKSADNKLILGGDELTPELLRKYGVDYVMIGPQEIAHGASRAYWDEHAVRVYDSDGYAVYRTKS